MDCPFIVSLAQINFHPAYISSGINNLVEPLGDETTSLSKIDTLSVLSDQLKSRYITWLSSKVKNIINCCINNKSNLLVFPEYSIPAELLIQISQQIKDSQLIVIAGSHMITSNYFGIYNELALDIDDNKICCAISPILSPIGVNTVVYKYNKSKWENSLELPQEESFNWLTINADSKEINLGIFLCIDGLRKPFHDAEKENALVVVPSWSPSIEPFDAVALQAMYNELPFVYVNTSIIGGSKMSAPFPVTDKHWFAEKNSTKAVPRNTECILTVQFDLANIRRSKSTVREHTAAEILEVNNILYTISSKDIEDRLNNLEQAYSEVDITYINDNCSDELLRVKMSELSQRQRMGILRNEKRKELCNRIMIDDVNYNDLKQELNQTALDFLIGNSHLLGDPEILKNLSTLSGRAGQNKAKKQETPKLINDSKPFFDRDVEQNKIRDFLNSPSEKLLILQGIRGIGKSTLLDQIQKRIIPPNNPWKIITIRFSSGFGFPLFFDDFAFQLGLKNRFDVGSPESALLAIRSLLTSLEAYVATIILIDDFHHVLDMEGRYLDVRFKMFIDEFIRRSSTIHKMVISTNRNINFERQEEAFNNRLTLKGLKDEIIKNIIDFHYKNFTGRLESIEISEKLVSHLYGNPLAAVITAQYLQNHPIDYLENSSDLFRRFQEQLITNLLEEISLKPEEKELLYFIATSKNEIRAEVLTAWKPGLIGVIDSLCARFLLEFIPENNTYHMHPLIHDFYYNELPFKERIALHATLAQLNENKLTELKAHNDVIPPKLLSEIIYHFAGSFQRERLRDFGIEYQEELVPIAKKLFKEEKYDKALEYFLFVNEFSPTKRLDVIEKICMCYGNLNDWDNARKYFNEAILLQNKPSLYAEFATLMAIKTRYFAEAESWVMQGEEVFVNSVDKRNWEYAKIKHSLGRIRERQHQDNCISFYREACALDKTKLYYKYRLALALIRWGFDPTETIEQGLAIKSDYTPLLKLKDGLTPSEDTADEEIEEEYETVYSPTT